jgi:hypothetical protein
MDMGRTGWGNGERNNDNKKALLVQGFVKK